MIFDILQEYFKKYLYIIQTERLVNKSTDSCIDRYTAKHALLRPEILVVNDQPFGFKKLPDGVSTLENFPIFLEIEYREIDGGRFVENVDMYAELKMTVENFRSELKYLARIYDPQINFELCTNILEPENQSLLIYSKLGEVVSDRILDMEFEETYFTVTEFKAEVEMAIVSLLNVIKILDDVVIKGKALTRLEQLFKLPKRQ